MSMIGGEKNCEVAAKTVDDVVESINEDASDFEYVATEEELEKEIEALKLDCKYLEDQLKDREGVVSSLTEEKSRLTAEVEELEKDVEDSTDALTKAEIRAEELEDQLESANSKLYSEVETHEKEVLDLTERLTASIAEVGRLTEMVHLVKGEHLRKAKVVGEQHQEEVKKLEQELTMLKVQFEQEVDVNRDTVRMLEQEDREKNGTIRVLEKQDQESKKRILNLERALGGAQEMIQLLNGKLDKKYVKVDELKRILDKTEEERQMLEKERSEYSEECGKIRVENYQLRKELAAAKTEEQAVNSATEVLQKELTRVNQFAKIMRGEIEKQDAKLKQAAKDKKQLEEFVRFQIAESNRKGDQIRELRMELAAQNAIKEAQTAAFPENAFEDACDTFRPRC